MIEDRFGNATPPDHLDGHRTVAADATAKSTSRGYGP
jgi:hypothetical protein